MNKIPQIVPVLGPEEREEVLKVMDSGFITEGKKTREFEAELAKYFGVPHALVVNNATVALTIALQGLGIGPGDEVIVPDFTFIATAHAVSLAGAAPVFADVSRDTFTLDLGDAERRITSRTRAILPVHLNGRACDMKQADEFARKHKLALIEDAAQAMGSSQRGQFLGTFGDAGVFSLGTTKIITCGQGGIILTRRKGLYEAFARICAIPQIARADRDDTPNLPVVSRTSRTRAGDRHPANGFARECPLVCGRVMRRPRRACICHESRGNRATQLLSARSLAAMLTG